MSKTAKKVTTKAIEANVSKPKTKKIKTKRCQSWEVWVVNDLQEEYTYGDSHKTKKEAEYDIAHGYFTHPVIVHIDIPSMEYDR